MKRQGSLHDEAKWQRHPRLSSHCVSSRELWAVSPTTRISVRSCMAHPFMTEGVSFLHRGPFQRTACVPSHLVFLLSLGAHPDDSLSTQIFSRCRAAAHAVHVMQIPVARCLRRWP